MESHWEGLFTSMYTLVCACESLLTSHISSGGLAHRVHPCFWALALDARSLRDEVCTRSLVIAAPSGDEPPQYLILFVIVLVVCLDVSSECQGVRSCNRRSPPFAERSVGAPTRPGQPNLSSSEVAPRSPSPSGQSHCCTYNTRHAASEAFPALAPDPAPQSPPQTRLPCPCHSLSLSLERGGAGAADSMHA